MSWDKKPTISEYWEEDCEYVMAIDENGTVDLKGLTKKINKSGYDSPDNTQEILNDPYRWFTISGVVMSREQFPCFRNKIVSLKENYWKDGLFNYKNGLRRVVFHSRDIRKKIGPFSPNVINLDDFMIDLANLIEQINYVIFSSTIDKVHHIKKYTSPHHPYELCLEFILERYSRYLNNQRRSGIVLLESRGKKEDKEILAFISRFLEEGNQYYSPSHLSCIKGVYFNPKWQPSSKGRLSYPLLELCDLVSYPIHKYCKFKTEDKAFEVVKRKLFNYPNCLGYGLKIFP